ncbi:unnamed protein product, partial [Medioppia subpectinata]
EMCGPSSECFVGLLANIISPVVCGLCDRVAKEPIHSPSCGKVFCADCTANDSIDGITGLAHNMDVCARNPTIYCADCGHRLAIRGHDCVHRLKARVESLTEYCEKLLGAERLVTSSPILSTASTDVTTDDRRLAHSMPGYDKQRFVDISIEDLNEFMCGICMDVFESPVFSPCCRQTYCKDCITGWLKNQKTCPNDRKPLTVNLLSSPPRVLTNLMNKLRIRCDFQDKGCQEVVRLSDLSAHTDSCYCNPNRKCTDCALPVGVGHNCLANMKLTIESITDEMKRLKRENTQLKTESDRYKRTQNNTANVGREDKTLRIVNSRMNETMKEFAINVANEAHDRYRSEPEGRLSTFVRNEFEKKYKSLWNCLVSSSINWGTSIHHFENHYIYFKIGLFHFMIWESSK